MLLVIETLRMAEEKEAALGSAGSDGEEDDDSDDGFVTSPHSQVPKP